MSKRPIALFFLAIFMSFASGCTAYRLTHSTKFEKPKVKFSGYHVRRVTERKTEVDFIVLVENPNPVGVKGVSADYELFIDEHRFAAGKAVNVELAPGRETAVTIPVVVRYEELLNALGPALGRFLSNQKSMPITVSARVYGSPTVYSDTENGWVPSFERRINKTIDVPLPEDEIKKERRKLEKAIKGLF